MTQAQISKENRVIDWLTIKQLTHLKHKYIILGVKVIDKKEDRAVYVCEIDLNKKRRLEDED